MTKVYKLMKAYYFMGNSLTLFTIEWIKQKLKEMIDQKEVSSLVEAKNIATHLHSKMQQIIPMNDDEELALNQTNIRCTFNKNKFNYIWTLLTTSK